MKNNKGFTLIELLAVIVILAIIALIATPTILGVVEDARKGSAESSLLGWIDAVEKQGMINELDADTTNDLVDGTYRVTDTGIISTATGASDFAVGVKGQRPAEYSEYATEFTVSGGEITGTPTFKVGKYYVTYTASSGKASASATAPAASQNP